jgi:hypothetical protein
MKLLSRISNLRRNPFFRHELARKGRRRWAAGLTAASLSYVSLFLLARVAWAFSLRVSGAPALTAPFRYGAWLLAGAALLSLCAHWLVPLFSLSILRPSYELRTFILVVAGRHTEEEALCGELAAGLFPLALGILPLFLGLPALILFGADDAPAAAVGLCSSVLWAALAAGASLWIGIRAPGGRAVASAYLLTSLALPLGIGALTLGIAEGCSLGHPHQAVVFRIAAVVTWSILVLGLAATFWDCSLGRLFPEKRRSLWQETAGPVRLEP